MKRPRRKLYCWLSKPGEWRLGREPPDIPIGPYSIFKSMDEVERAFPAARYEIIWCGKALEMREQMISATDVI